MYPGAANAFGRAYPAGSASHEEDLHLSEEGEHRRMLMEIVVKVSD